MKLLITHAGAHGWEVWLTLDGHDALIDWPGFVVGRGATRDAAVAAAVKDLEVAVEELQAPPGTVEERSTE